MRPACLVWLSLITCAVGGCSPPATDLRARAQAAIARHDFRAARLDLIAILDTRPGDRETIMTLARTDLSLKRGEEAEATLRKAGGAGPRESEIGSLMAEALLQQAKPDKALAVLGRLAPSATTYRLQGAAYALLDDRARAEGAVDAGLKAFPGDAPLLVEAARIHLALGKSEQANGESGRAIAADPKSVDARLIGARIALAENLPAMAWRNATQALALWPDNIDALLIRAVALGNLGRLTEMAATLDRVDQLQGAKPATRILRARLLAQQQRWQESSDQLALAGDAVRADPRTLLLSGEVAARLHKPEAAIASLSAYLTALPNDAKGAELLAEQKLIVGDADGARKTLDPFLTRPDVSPGLLAVAARAALRDHQPALAAKLSARSRYPSPQYLGKLILAANAAMQSERWGDAILLYQEVQNTTRAENIFVLNNLGWALFRANRTSEALRILAQAYRLNGKNASVVDSYGWVMLKTGGDRVRAVKLLQDAAALAPQNRLIQNHLSQSTIR